MPLIRSADTSTTMHTAGRLKIPVTVAPFASVTTLPSGMVSASGMWMPTSRAKLTKYPLQPTATVLTLSAYSRIRSQPMIHATNSPIVAYAYVYALPAIGTIAANSA